MTRRQVGLAAAAAIIGLILLGGLVYASIPSPSGVVNGCYSNGTVNGVHGLGVVDSTGTCPSGTTALNWNQTGPQGPAGPTGPQGSPGISGWNIVTAPGVTPLNDNSVFCPAGQNVLGGGYGITDNVSVLRSRPVTGPNGTFGWNVNVSSATLITVYAICATVST